MWTEFPLMFHPIAQLVLAPIVAFTGELSSLGSLVVVVFPLVCRWRHVVLLVLTLLDHVSLDYNSCSSTLMNTLMNGSAPDFFQKKDQR
jgi:hypothetical protein